MPMLSHLYRFMKFHRSHSAPSRTMTATGSDFGICRLHWAFPSIILWFASLPQSGIVEATLVRKGPRPCLPLTGPQLPPPPRIQITDVLIHSSGVQSLACSKFLLYFFKNCYILVLSFLGVSMGEAHIWHRMYVEVT